MTVDLLIPSLIMGILYLSLAFLVKKKPQLIVRYLEDNIKLSGFPIFLQRVLLTTGIATALLGILSFVIESETMFNITILSPTIIMLLFIILKSSKVK